MGLFQKSVLNRYLKALPESKISQAFIIYKVYFHNPVIQKQIRNSKEEQFQEGFLRELFVNILGYTINPNPDFNLITEQKNVSDSKKADGAILVNGVIKAVIELKGTDTIDLHKIQQQAFYYLSAHPEAEYVITSNFEKLRFYIHKSNEFEEFNLFALSLDEFKILYLCLGYESIAAGIPAKIKNESVIKEEDITKELYKDYSNFKNALYTSLCDRNPDYDKLSLFKASQKLIDRFLFIFFCEDNNGLLPANSIAEIIKHWNKLREMDEYRPLYDIFKKYFEYINNGRVAAGDKQEIFAYNGGLFAEDTFLDHLVIDDDVLYTHTQKLSKYDFISEVDVNILGHIFEHSLNEIEEIQAEIEGNPVDKSKTKRKKDGVFYTPKYITEYIVESTIGKLCEDKKLELKIDEPEFVAATKKDKRKPLKEKLDAYKSYLLSLSICDPACGSGAFLNQAYVYLHKEHQYVAELESKLFDAPMVVSDVSSEILENNLFGVDINEESVEIARLALWLRSAKKGRKLNNLSNNIKCGNSLIDDVSVAGDKAFKWEEEFPQVFRRKELEAFHVVFTTHNSRISHRMAKLGIIPSNPVELNLAEEIVLTQIFHQIVKEKDYKILAFNICKDHTHLIIVCENDELNHIVKTLKGKSAYEFNKWKRTNHTPKPSNGFQPIAVEDDANGLKPVGDYGNNSVGDNGNNPNEQDGHLWSQKYFRANLDVWELAELSSKPGYIYGDKYINNAIAYISTNREKHQLPESKDLNQIISEMIVDEQIAFSTQYTGGFDVVIGNPPYGAKIPKPELDYLVNSYEQFGLNKVFSDTYIAFYILGISNLLVKNGILGFIAPNTWRLVSNGLSFRKYFTSQQFSIYKIIQHTEKVFIDATVDVDTVIIKNKQSQGKLQIIIGEIFNKYIKHEIEQVTLFNQDYINLYLTDLIYKIKAKIESNSHKAQDLFEIKNGVKPYEVGKGTPAQTKETLLIKPFTSEIKIDESFSPLIRGSSFNKYQLLWDNNYWIQYGDWLAAPRNKEIFLAKEKLIFRQTSDKIIGMYISDGFIMRNNTHILLKYEKSNLNLKYALSIFNSKLINYYYQLINPEKGEALAEVKAFHLSSLPFKNISLEIQQPFIRKADIMLDLHKSLYDKQSKFISRLQSNLTLDKITTKIEKFYDADFKTLIGELKKQKIVLSLKDQDEWEDYFNSYKHDINTLQQQIATTDNEIDQMVYELYGLTDEEIKVVENG